MKDREGSEIKGQEEPIITLREFKDTLERLEVLYSRTPGSESEWHKNVAHLLKLMKHIVGEIKKGTIKEDVQRNAMKNFMNEAQKYLIEK